jgi:hypothetical protein
MGELLHGQFKLRIESVRNRRDITDRYNAVIISVGERVSVKFKNHGKDPQSFVGKIGIFDGDRNDIQLEPTENIDESRAWQSFENPFITEAEAKAEAERSKRDLSLLF